MIAQIMPVECDDGRIEQLNNELRIRGKLWLGNVPEVPYVAQPYQGLRKPYPISESPSRAFHETGNLITHVRQDEISITILGVSPSSVNANSNRKSPWN